MHSSTNRQDPTEPLNRSNLVTRVASTASLQSRKRWQLRQRSGSTPKHRAVTVNVESSNWDSLLRQQALTAIRQGEYEQAIELFTELVDRNPLSANDYNNRGLVYFQSGQFDEAIADYDRALEINPTLDSVYNNRANYYAAKGQLLDAIVDYEIALDLNPSNIRAWINQGITLRDLQLYDQAIESFDLALCFGRLEGHIYAERGRTYHLWGDWNYAIADYQRAIAHLPLTMPATEPSARLRLQVEVWLDDLLSPLELEE